MTSRLDLMPDLKIDTPDLRELHWHRMRTDLASYMPDISETKLLMCPACGRFLPQEDFGLEHIIPQQALKDDHPTIRTAVPINQRAGTTLLCNRQLIVKGKKIHANGCNSWKGKYVDTALRDLFNGRAMREGRYSSHQSVSLLIACYLGAFAKYGYRIALDGGGLIMREQFFHPYRFIGAMPLQSQMVLSGDIVSEYKENLRDYWATPFKFHFERSSFIAVVRSVSMYLPISRDPAIPIAKILRFAPSKYVLRPNFITGFD